MDLNAVIAELREHLATVERSLAALERFAAGTETSRPGSPSMWMSERIATRPGVIRNSCEKSKAGRRDIGSAKKLR